MKNILLKIQYDGTNYQGWQTQRKQGKTRFVTIQETIEKVLSQILQEKISLNGSGRTDSGVHALAQIANFKTNSLMPLSRMKIALNGLLPSDIRIILLKKVLADFHARFSAKSKVYRYVIVNKSYCPVFIRKYAWHITHTLDIEVMKQEAKVLLGSHDFKSFQAADKTKKDSVRTIKTINIIKRNNCINICIEADGFLYNMMRNIVGTLIEIGRGKFPPGSLKRILQRKDRKKAGVTAPSKGLCLDRVIY